MTAMARRQAGFILAVTVASDLWAAAPTAEAAVRRAIAAANGAIAPPQGEVDVSLIDDAAIRPLNRTWRGIDKATNVLSFPTAAPRGAAPALLGDIVIAYQTTAREAEADRLPFAHHLAHLAIHGYLHLLGYDHESDDDAEAMERLETRILAEIGIADPHALRDEAR